jgi:hypothetical protein
MSILIKHEDASNYCLFDIPYIRENQEEILQALDKSVEKIVSLCNSEEKNVTWLYNRYNIFSINAGNIHFYNIYKEINNCIKQYFHLCGVTNDGQLWMQAWLNYHNSNQLLARHDHQSPINGYLSVDPKETETIFYYKHSDEVYYTVKNKPGQLYIGPGKTDHKVELLKPFDGIRTTIAFDIDDVDSDHLGMIPLLL